ALRKSRPEYLGRRPFPGARPIDAPPPNSICHEQENANAQVTHTACRCGTRGFLGRIGTKPSAKVRQHIFVRLDGCEAGLRIPFRLEDLAARTTAHGSVSTHIGRMQEARWRSPD